MNCLKEKLILIKICGTLKVEFSNIKTIVEIVGLLRYYRKRQVNCKRNKLYLHKHDIYRLKTLFNDLCIALSTHNIQSAIDAVFKIL